MVEFQGHVLAVFQVEQVVVAIEEFSLHGVARVEYRQLRRLRNDDLRALLFFIILLQEHAHVAAAFEVEVVGDKYVVAATHVDEFAGCHFLEVELGCGLGLQVIAGAEGPGPPQDGYGAGYQRYDQGQLQHRLDNPRPADARRIQCAHLRIAIQATNGCQHGKEERRRHEDFQSDQRIQANQLEGRGHFQLAGGGGRQLLRRGETDEYEDQQAESHHERAQDFQADVAVDDQAGCGPLKAAAIVPQDCGRLVILAALRHNCTLCASLPKLPVSIPACST